MKTLRIAGTCLSFLLFATAVFTFVAPRFGWSVDTVLSGSMEPRMGTGSVAITRPAATGSISVGDIIKFRSPLDGKPITHRVIEIVNGASYGFRTKGDANEDMDPFVVPVANLVGKVCFHLPWAGYISQELKTRWGLMAVIFLPGLVIVSMEIRNIWIELSAQEIEKKYRIIR